MRNIALTIIFVALTSCLPSTTPDVALAYHVGGRVHGLWTGADGVSLRLHANGTEAILTVPANGTFSFADLIAAGTAYTVTVMSPPVRHTCAIDAGASGVVEETDVTTISVACMGPQVAIELSGLWGWRFDATEDTQTFAGSIAAQEVAFTISGDALTGARVAGGAATLGNATAPIALQLGRTTVPVTLAATGGLSKTYQLVFERGASVLDQVTYGKASNTDMNDSFGNSIAIYGDTLAVAAAGESSAARGIDGDQADNSVASSGAVYVFVRNGMTWTQQAYLKASNTDRRDVFGRSLALFEDTLAVGSFFESSAASGVNGNADDNTAFQSGAVYVFVRTGATWSQQAYVKASNPRALSWFGTSVALARDTLAVGAPGEYSAATGINGNQSDTSATAAGAAYVFRRAGTTWTQQAYIKPSNTAANFNFGESIALSGNTLAVGALGAAAVYIFVFNNGSWTQESSIRAPNVRSYFEFGTSVALSGDTLAVTAPGEDSGATGVNGNQDDYSAHWSGAVYVFVRDSGTWTQQAYIKASNTETYDRFGTSIALFGSTLAIGASDEASAATGVDGNQADNSAAGAGAIYVFARTGSTWAQQAYIKATNTDANDLFGTSVALSGDTLAVGAGAEASAAVGIDGNQADNTAPGAGAVYLFR